MNNRLQSPLNELANKIAGELFYDDLSRSIYATDASVYQEMPLAVVYPKSDQDIKSVIQFAKDFKVSLIPRAAGTSLAGQVVGHGIVMDISKYLNRIIEVNLEEQWVQVQPGVVRDELNEYLKPFGFFFGPNTSTANRAMIGGMVGNNSCGQSSIVYGSTRDHVLELNAILSDGTDAHFHGLTTEQFHDKCTLPNLEGDLYRFFRNELSNKDIQQNIRKEFPKPSIRRRNTGYAVDYLLDSTVFTKNGPAFNLCKLLCGSEGTLAFTTKIKLHIDPLPEPHEVVVAIHSISIQDALVSTQVAMEHAPTACELMDKIILDCTKENINQSKNRFFVVGDPAAIVLVEFRGKSEIQILKKAETLIENLKQKSLGYAYPIITSPHTNKVWDLRKAGLGLLSNIRGDKKAVACIEDTAVDLVDLPAYIGEFTELLNGYHQEAVYYAHAGDGEIHLRPILDLKKTSDREDFYHISRDIAHLVKKYQGSLSGEHGDGRLRGVFIPFMVGDINYQLLKRVKSAWDPQLLFNPGKIVDVPKMNTSLRYTAEQINPVHETLLDFTKDGGILRLAEKCSGSGDCRKLPLSGGTMCPSYQATRNEKDTTRARANTLRNYLTKNVQPNPFNQKEIKDVMDLCLSCKGCTSECPSNVDIASMKAEFFYQFYKSNKIPLRTRVFAQYNRLNSFAGLFPKLSNAILSSSAASFLLKKALKIAPKRSLPSLSNCSLSKWYKKQETSLQIKQPIKTVFLFCDEFTNYNDAEIGKKAILLLKQLGYQVKMITHAESGRAAISKGLLDLAKKCAEQNVNAFGELVSKDTPLLGIEPSAILSFVDEYPRLVAKEHISAAKKIANHAMLIDDFILSEIDLGNIKADQFTSDNKHIILHGHCHQKSLSSINTSAKMLSLPENYVVTNIPSGCCGMAGSFGYEDEHYEVSMQIGELVLFPAIRAVEGAVVAAPGTSCRHQIKDGTYRNAYHPIEIMFDSLK